MKGVVLEKRADVIIFFSSGLTDVWFSPFFYGSIFKRAAIRYNFRSSYGGFSGWHSGRNCIVWFSTCKNKKKNTGYLRYFS